MNEIDRAAITTLEMIADCHAVLGELCQAVRRQPEVSSVEYAVEIRRYGDDPWFEGYVDAELKCDKSICWWLEMNWPSGQWEIGYSILITESQGQSVLKKFPTEVVTSFQDLPVTLLNCARQLRASLDSVDLSKDPPVLRE